MRTRVLVSTAAVLSMLGPAAALSQEIEPDVRYQGETTLQASEYGISFLLPEGWVGMLPQGAEMFVMQSATFQAYIFAGIEEMTLSEAQELMGADIDLGEGIVLHPAGEVAADGATLSADYTISGAPDPLVGRVVTIIGDHGFGVYFVVASSADAGARARDAIGSISASVRLVDPQPPPATATEAGGPWEQELRGKKLSHFYTATGYTEEDYIWLCTDGRFYRSSNSGGFGGGASGAFSSDWGGRWQATGDASAGTLVLTYNDGSTSTFSLSIEDEKLFLNGGRYFREVEGCG